MTADILEKLKAVRSKHFTSEQFLSKIPCYEMKIGDIQVYFSECDFQSGKNLRRKGIIDFILIKGNKRTSLKVTKEMILDTNFIKGALECAFNNYAE